ncbi:hypothetical protein RclHR1_01520013 [Rhizophagus clarus]|uniref:BTB domain-containing protein n=1 Tax=Rhizophagus clarus TaxID=94130 RepID=A0A2Z6R7B8_9GLOM|nr:hypothetical protein RclHR1_01520013 [Rhizophagus clarus]GES78724.1 hypothetical protein GLOIN_2v1545410 [Rhizophagus clarus]
MKNRNYISEQDNSSPRGRSLENDFKILINDERFYDIALKCSDGKTVYGCKAILATRSDVFNSSIFNESAERNNILSFDDINSTAMKVIMEFLYTSKVGNLLNADNVVEVYYASIQFDLIDLQDHVIEFTKSLINEEVDIGKKLLSECVKKFSLKVDNEMSQILVNCVSKNKLEKSEIDSLSLEGLRYLLEKTFDTQIPFATPEFNIWEYSLIKAIKVVVKNETLVEGILDKNSFSPCEPQEAEEIKNHLILLIDYINLNRMDVEEIKKHVEPFNIHTINKLKDVYRSMAENEESGFIRGIPIFRWKDDDKNLVNIFNNGFTVETVPHNPALRSFMDREVKEVVGTFLQPKSILGDLTFKGKGVYEWNILIEKLCKNIYIGIVDIREDLTNFSFSFSNFSFTDHRGWVLGSDGYVYYKNEWKWYDSKFKEGDKVTVHLDMKDRTCAFSINDNRKPLVSEWKNIPSRVYPIVSLGYGSKVTLIY